MTPTVQSGVWAAFGFVLGLYLCSLGLSVAPFLCGILTGLSVWQVALDLTKPKS